MTDDTIKAARDERAGATFPRLAKWTTRPDIEIVSHCWNYGRLLQWQVSSLIQWPPTCRVQLSVCYCPEHDQRTAEVVAWACEAVGDTVAVLPVEMDRGRLLRRAIGRNACAQESTAEDLVWFADCDMLFTEGCLDGIRSEIAGLDAKLYFPRIVGKIPHADGDWMIQTAEGYGLQPIFMCQSNQSKFMPTRHRRAIGGIQIVPAETAREFGYLPHHKRFQRPASQWMRTKEDPIFRKYLGSGGTPLETTGALRIRHSRYGRSHIGTIN